jgi:hypothetical protein
MRGGLHERWRGQPLWARWVLTVYLIGFFQGACLHFFGLVRGGVHAYASLAPVPLRVFFVSLLVLDPLVVVLVGFVRPEGVQLASGVILIDAIANWVVNWSQLQEDPSSLLRPVGLLPITLFCLFVLATLVPLRRVTRAGGISAA